MAIETTTPEITPTPSETIVSLTPGASGKFKEILEKQGRQHLRRDHARAIVNRPARPEHRWIRA